MKTMTTPRATPASFEWAKARIQELSRAIDESPVWDGHVDRLDTERRELKRSYGL